MSNKQAGVLLHPTSLPNPNGGLGALNEQAWRFLDWMQQANLCVWQMLPLTCPHDDLSPYQAVSAFAMNVALLPEDWTQHLDKNEFAQFLDNEPHWLDDYALFVAIREKQHYASWSDWPEGLKHRETQALADFKSTHQSHITFLKQQQFVLQKLWTRLKTDANAKGIQLFGDMPIFVSYDSADVWANPEQFLLDENLQPTFVAGVPPDYFSETGQRWGNPHYDWEQMQSDEFSWWRQRVAAALEQFDLIRIDHFRGLQACWYIPADEETAINGEWQEAPGAELLQYLQNDFPNLPLVAEDLGIITPEVVALKEQFELPGMSVLQFGFNGLPDNPHSLQEQVEHSVVYTGTHDNDTTLGWFSAENEGAQQWIQEQLLPQVSPLLNQAGLPETMPWMLITAALQSVANLTIVPMQDWLALGSDQRMNTPGTMENNWQWQFDWQVVSSVQPLQIASLIEQTQRCQAQQA